MGWRKDYWRQNLRRSFRDWERGEAMTSLLTLVIALVLGAITLLSTVAITGSWLVAIVPGVGIGLVVFFVVLSLVITPMRMWREKAKIVAELTTKRLEVPRAEVYDDGAGCHWLRLQVINPAASPIPDCYGKSLSYRLLNYPLIHNGPHRQPVSPERGHQRSEHGQWPPDKHPFPWQPIPLPPPTIAISGHGGFEFLYVVSKREGSTSFGTPTDMGVKYDNWGAGDYEVELEIGSESEAFQPTKVRVVFRATGGEIQFISLDTLN